jgi:hypothetical protein
MVVAVAVEGEGAAEGEEEEEARRMEAEEVHMGRSQVDTLSSTIPTGTT